VGTIVTPGHQRNALVQNDTVFVLWDNGQLANYRVGKDADVQDLLVFDNGPAGMRTLVMPIFLSTNQFMLIKLSSFAVYDKCLFHKIICVTFCALVFILNLLQE